MPAGWFPICMIRGCGFSGSGRTQLLRPNRRL